MSLTLPETLFVAASLAIGWAALWQLRDALGQVGYHLSALPVGLLAWPMAASFGSMIGRSFDWIVAAAGVVALVSVIRLVALLCYEHPASQSCLRRGQWRSFILYAMLMLTTAAVAGFARLSIVTADSYREYWPLGVWLSLDGSFTDTLVASRSILIPSMNAAHILLGSDWAYVVFPILAINLLGVLVKILLINPSPNLGQATKILVATGAAGFLVTDPTFLYHSLYVHSHMISALYLLLSLAALWMASDYAPERRKSVGSKAWLVVAGSAAAGLALARPDGLVYIFVPIIIAIAVLTSPNRDVRADIAFFGPLLMLVCSAYGAAFLELGLWSADKLDGTTALGILTVLGLTAATPWLLRALDSRVPFDITGERSALVLVVTAVLLLGAVFASRWETASLALAHARINLFGSEGGWGHLWWAFAVLLGLSIMSCYALHPRSWTHFLFLSIVLFFIVAGVVHGTSHAGRIGTGDSFNRVAFHIVPVIVWYAASVLVGILGDLRGKRSLLPDSGEPERS